MTIEELRIEMIKRGCNKAMIESKTAGVVLDIIGKTDGEWIKAQNAKNELDRITETLANRREDMREWERAAAEKERKHRQTIERQKEEYNEYVKRQSGKIETFLANLEELETPEARDAYKTAQLFVNTANKSMQSVIDKPSVVAAYITGLAAILSRGNVPTGGGIEFIEPIFAAPEKRSLGRI